MKILGIVAEYNPFHLGHKYHLDQSKKITAADYSIAIMSGSFVQRGEPAIIDKFERARSAIENGFDLVIELPFACSCQTAEVFAKGAISTLHSLNCVDYLCFGSEYEDITILKEIARILAEEPYDYLNLLKANIEKTFSYPLARSKSLEEYFALKEDPLVYNIDEILNGSNNILAIEYLRQLIALDSPIKPIAIKRMGNNYSDRNLGRKFSSATSIRQAIFTNKFDHILDYLPKSSLDILRNYREKYGNFNKLENYYTMINYSLITSSDKDIIDTFDLGEDLGNRFLNTFGEVSTMEDLVRGITNKNYTRSRVQRAIINIILKNSKETHKNIMNNTPDYIRILASNKKGFEILNKIKKESDTLIINKFSDYLKYKDLYPIMDLEVRATNLYYLGLLNSPKNSMDFLSSPYIKK